MTRSVTITSFSVPLGRRRNRQCIPRDDSTSRLLRLHSTDLAIFTRVRRTGAITLQWVQSSWNVCSYWRVRLLDLTPGSLNPLGSGAT